jgi:hypothetical protein
VLTAGGPLLVDVWLTLDGRPHAEVFAARIEQILDAGDTNGDRKSTWNELAANDEFLNAERATNPNTPDARAKAWTDRFDLNRDKQIQPDEAAAWLGRDAGRSAAALALRSRRSYRAIPALKSRVWQLLDADTNGRLSGGELDAAPEKFLAHDANDDRIITLPELAPLRDQLSAGGMQAPNVDRSDSRHAALQLEPDSDVERVNFLLADLYSPLQNLGPGSFPNVPRLFDELDSNGDRHLEYDDVARFMTIEPHLELAVAFEKPDASGRGQARLEVRRHGPEIDVAARPAANRVALFLGNTQIAVSAHDLATSESAEPSGERSEIRAMIHDECDALLEMLDQNADGRLGEREIMFSPTRLLERDANEDRELTNDELPAAMIVAFLRSERPAEESFYVPETVATAQPNVHAPAWFASADFNNDGDVSRREFVGSIEQFSRLDADQDGFLAADEAAAAIPQTTH